MTTVIFLAVIGVLIFVHEFGHFIAAKRAGMKVEEFGFGFPPRVFGKKYRGTVYSLNWIPFGGFVKIFGEDGGHHSDPHSFGAQSFMRRISVVLAGVTMNFLLAAFLLIVGNGFGLRIGFLDSSHLGNARDVRVQILEVAPQSPAQVAGLVPLDELIQFTRENKQVEKVIDPEQVQQFIGAHAGELITVTVHRGDKEFSLQIPTRANPPSGQGPLGISMALTGVVSYPWYEALWRGVMDAAFLLWNTIRGYALLLSTLLFEQKLIADVSGPVGIAKLTGQAAQMGLNYFIQFVAMISINLTVLNIIPFPALDGGRLVLLIAEKIKGSPLNRRVETYINIFGFAILITFMIFITVKDVIRLF